MLLYPLKRFRHHLKTSDTRNAAVGKHRPNVGFDRPP